MELTFLHTDVPLTKTITMLPNGSILKDAYPLRKNFTSTTFTVNTIGELHDLIDKQSRAKHKPCMLKGTLNYPLVNEPRASSTQPEATTESVVFDLDKAPYHHPDEFMAAIGLGKIAYSVQYSSSYKLDPLDRTLSCHIFCMLDKPFPAQLIKSWLMHLNLTVPSLRAGLTLSQAGHALHWPLDITVCQNDKLIYIAEPTFIGMDSPIPTAERVQLRVRPTKTISTSIIKSPAIETMKKQIREITNAMRKERGLDALRATVLQGTTEVQKGVGEITLYEVFDDPDNPFVYFNPNGGDSKAYYHPRHDLTLLHNFKGEPATLIKEVLPYYFNDRTRAANVANAAPSETGDLLLAFREKVTAEYWKGTWNATSRHLDIHKVKSKDMLEDFCKAHGHTLGDFVPEWHMLFNPQSTVVLDEPAHKLNTFVPSYYMHEDNQRKGQFPAIQTFLDHAVGTGPIQEHFVNWLAYMFKHRQKPKTAWILHGTEGTGKGMLVDKVLTPLFGHRHLHRMRASEFDEKFNGWIENSLLVFIDEIEADMFSNPKGIESDMRNLVTEPVITIRRMRTDSYMVDNFTGFILSSNKPQPVHIPASDRRYNVGTFNPKRFHPTDAQVEALSSDKELAAFAYFLQHHKACGKTARSILQTADRLAIQQLGVTSVDKLAQDILGGNFSGMLDALPDERLMHEQANGGSYTALTYMNLVKRFATDIRPSKITRDELAAIFKHCVGNIPEGAHKFSSYLRHHGINISPVRVDGEVHRGCIVNWTITQDDKDYMAQITKPPIAKPSRLRAVK